MNDYNGDNGNIDEGSEFFGPEDWDNDSLNWEEINPSVTDEPENDDSYQPKLVTNEPETLNETVNEESNETSAMGSSFREELEEIEFSTPVFNAESLLREPYQMAAREVFAAGFIPKLFDVKTGEQYTDTPPPEGSVVVKAVQVPYSGTGKAVVNLYCSVSKSISKKNDTDTATARDWKKILILGGIGVVAVALIATLSIFVYSKIQESKTVVVPNVSGVTVDRATQLLAESDLAVGTVQEISSLDQPSGVVLSQSPSAGSQVKPQSGITIVVSSGPKTVETPELVGVTSEQAENTLAAINLVLGSSTEKDSEQPVGTVIEQSVSPGTPLREGAAVDIVVSNGKTAVPSVIGKTLEQASTELAEKGFKVKPVRVTQEGPSGTVVGQNPEANTYLAPDSEVEVTYTTPPAEVPETPTPEPTPTP